jgi:serine/threonine-protein kinase
MPYPDDSEAPPTAPDPSPTPPAFAAEPATEPAAASPAPPPRRTLWIAVYTVLLVLAAGGLSVITAIRIGIQGREVEVPNVVQMQAGEAQAALARRGLGMKIADRAYSSLPVDYIVRQSPLPGATVKTGQRAHVVLSLGPQRVSIPELEGKSTRAARVELLRSGLQLGEVTVWHTPELEPDTVVRQFPPPRATNAGSPRVNLLVSASPLPPSYVMPDYVGLPLSEVPARLTSAGLRLARIHFAASATLPKGTVMAQIPPRGTRVRLGTSVELQVVE